MSSRGNRSFFGWLLGMPEPPLETRLTADAAVELAAASAGVRELGRALPMAIANRDGDHIIWRVSSGGVGAQWWVEVDDNTGQVSDVHHAQGR